MCEDLGITVLLALVVCAPDVLALLEECAAVLRASVIVSAIGTRGSGAGFFGFGEWVQWEGYVGYVLAEYG